MLYLGIDQHKRQLTVNLRDESGKVILKRQVSTQWEKVRAFFADLSDKARPSKKGVRESAGQNRHGVADERAAWKSSSEAFQPRVMRRSW